MSEQLSDKLIEIPCSEWTTLRDMFLRDWPTHMVGYYTMDNYVRWSKNKSDIQNLKIYSLNGDWQRDGFFIVVDRYQVFLNTLNNDSIQSISRALVKLNWKHDLIFSSILDRHQPAVMKAFHTIKLTMACEFKNLVYSMSRVEAATLDVVLVNCPDGISLRTMTQEHASKADAEWRHTHQGSLFLLKRLINWNLNIGAFTDDGKLVAWCFRSQSGALATLYVDSNYKKRGLGTLVTKVMAKKLSELDMDTYAEVAYGNVASRNMFEKIGFKIVGHSCFMGTNPLVVSDWNDFDDLNS